MAIAEIKELVNADLQVVDQLILELAAKNAGALIPEITDYLMTAGGKRIRPILTLWFAQIFSYRGDAHIKLAASIELIHTTTLLHDDVIDESVSRRNRATANQMWGNKAAILVGDYLFSLAFKLMVETGNLKVLHSLSYASNIISEAEVEQIELTADLDINFEQYINLITKKTAVLFAAACESGAILGDEQDIKGQQAAKEYGTNLGIIFQIIDDILDYFSTDEKFGKSLGNDLRERKITLPLILLMQKSAESRVYLENIIKNSEESEAAFSANFSKIYDLLLKYDIKQECLKVAKKYCIIPIELHSRPEYCLLASLLEEALSRHY